MTWSLQGAGWWVGEDRWPRLSPDMAWSKVVHSIFYETSLGITTLDTSAQTLRKAAAASHSVLCYLRKHFPILLGRFQDGRERGATMATLPGETELSISGDLG